MTDKFENENLEELDEMDSVELIDLEDEDGNTETFEFIDSLEYKGNSYFALVPYNEEKEQTGDADEFVILKGIEEGEELNLVSIDDDDEYNAVGAEFLKQFESYFSEEE
ncbi:MAG: DUF1292 domain-containing protein [Clostridiales bacterium]|nr:DUF1292 domain-containing protein [Clostridiales bacterium]